MHPQRRYCPLESKITFKSIRVGSTKRMKSEIIFYPKQDYFFSTFVNIASVFHVMKLIYNFKCPS